MRLRLPRERRARTPAEVRDPRAATAGLSYHSPGRAMVPEWDAATAIRWGYLANTFVYRCVQVIARDVSRLPFRAGRDPSRRMDHHPDARLARLLGPPPGGPAPGVSARKLWANAVAQRLVTGRFGWEIETDRSEIVALWPLASSALRPIPSDGGTSWFAGFEYGRQDKPRRLGADQVFYDWQPSLSDWRQPESVLQAARLDVSVAVMQDRYDYAFLANDARPAAVIVHEAFAELDEREAFRSQFLADHSGPDNAGRPVFVEAEGGGEDGVKGSLLIQTLGLSQKDAEFIRRYESKLRAITVAFGVPLSILGDSSDRTFSNADQENRNYWEGLVPLLEDLADSVNINLAPRLGDEVGWFDLSEVEALRRRRFAAEPASALVAAEIVTKDEARQDYGLGPLPTPAPAPARAPHALRSWAGAQSSSSAATSAQAIVAAPTTVTVTAAPPAPSAPAAPSAPKRPIRQPVDHEARRTRLWQASDAQVRSLERSWERGMRRLFARQRDATLARLEGKRGRQAVAKRAMGDLFDPGYWQTETAEAVAALYEAVFVVGANKVVHIFGIDFDLEAPYVQEFIAARANRLAGLVTTTTYDAIKEGLAEGVAHGEGIPELAARVREVFDEASSTRAVTIARTEVISAYNGAATEVARSYPPDVVGGQEWIATRDGRTRADHADADGQVVAMGDNFLVGGEELAYPGDPAGSAENIVNCRCATAFLTPGEMAERSRRRVPVRAAEAVLVRLALGQIDQRAAEAKLAGVGA